MNNEERFWLSTWGILVSCIIVVVLLMTIYNNNRDARLERMVAEGADPIRASIALENINLSKINTLLIADVVAKEK